MQRAPGFPCALFKERAKEFAKLRRKSRRENENAYFPFQIQAINTDNGSEYLLHFHKELEEWGIPHYFTDPANPKQNARVERFHQTAEYEYFNYQALLPALASLREHCELFNDKYNYQRYHQSLGYKTPQQFVIEYQQKKGGLPSSI